MKTSEEADLGSSQITVPSALFPEAKEPAVLSDQLVQKWLKTPFFRLVQRSQETSEQITALLDHEEIQARFLSHSRVKSYLHMLAINNPNYCNAILASKICQNNPDIASAIKNERDIGSGHGHRCRTHPEISSALAGAS